jgi:predicted dehydrogenase
MSAQYRAAIIGHTGEGNYGHGLDMVYAQMPEVEVVAVADPDPEGLAAAAQRTGAPSSLAACYVFTNGVTAHFESQPGDTTARVNSRWFGFEVHGTEGIIALRNSPNGEMYIHRHGMFIPDGKVSWERVLLDEWEAIPEGERTHHSNVLIARELIQAIEEDRDVVEASSGKDARAALEMVMAVHESHRVQGRVQFPLANRENPYEVWRRMSA